MSEQSRLARLRLTCTRNMTSSVSPIIELAEGDETSSGGTNSPRMISCLGDTDLRFDTWFRISSHKFVEVEELAIAHRHSEVTSRQWRVGVGGGVGQLGARREEGRAALTRSSQDESQREGIDGESAGFMHRQEKN